MLAKDLYREYKTKNKLFEDLIFIAKQQLDHAIKRKRIKIHSLPCRIKSFDSFAKKARRKNLKDPLNEINDIVGLRVVCLFLSDLSEVGEIIKNTFKLIEEQNKIDGSPKNVFGYMDIQYVVVIRNSGVKELNKMPFEIQVKTITQDAWASISHHLDYKQRKKIPIEWERDFYALSGLFYVADQHFRILNQESLGTLFIEGTVGCASNAKGRLATDGKK